MKSTVARTLCPKDLEPPVVRDPTIKKLLSDPADGANVFGDTLLHLGGQPVHGPPKDFVDEVLSRSPTCPVSAKSDDMPSVSWQEFLNHLQQSKPSKAGDPDRTNNYILALCPEPIQRFFNFILNRFLESPLPLHYLCAKIFLLYKKGDPISVSNYRLIAVSNCIYKLLATFACKHLRSQVFAHEILSEIQHGGLPGHQCADYLYHPKALHAKSKNSYSLFFDFNRASNSVLHGTLWTVLERANFSTSTISLIKQLYSFPQDSFIINGRGPHSYLQGRGLRQGCPLCALLFILYLNSLFNHCLATVPPAGANARTSHHGYIDDILIKREDVVYMQNSLNYFDGPARAWGLDMNLPKAEVHANGTAPQKEFLTPRGSQFLTYNKKTRRPDTCNKYLGVYLFTYHQAKGLFHMLKAEIQSYFARLSPLPPTLSEEVQLTN